MRFRSHFLKNDIILSQHVRKIGEALISVRLAPFLAKKGPLAYTLCNVKKNTKKPFLYYCDHHAILVRSVGFVFTGKKQILYEGYKVLK